ncbi:YceH family protein [Pedobacter sp. L105]|uniref:YceH family protein n=1 Tax=Pedobacter sp. L105 TaxID=1641871 RepID=UPI00131B619F|nr:YceH family protein [Pedobacter sp. L105]
MENQPLSILNEAEQRVLGVLIEKSKTTPDYYPMTISALTTACNQKTSRNPIVNYDEETVILTLNTLKIKGLTSTATGGSSRSTKYKHNLAIVHPLVPAELTIICLLLLRGALTPGEINTNSARLYEFETIEEIQDILNKLASESPAFVKQLAKRPGQKESRYIHLLGPVAEEQSTTEADSPKPVNTDLEQRVLKLEQELEEVKEMLNLLMN